MSVLATNNLKQVNKEVCDVFSTGYKARVNTWDKVFNRKSPTRKDEITTIIKLDNNVTETTDGGGFTANDIKEIGEYTVTQKLFKDKITLGDFAEEFDNYGKIKQASREKGEDYKYHQDVLAVNFLNNPTSTTAPYGFQVDGATTTPLLSNTQPVGDTGVTQDNLVTGGLSKPNLNTSRNLLKKMKRHNGNIAGYQSRRFLHPTELTMTAWELTQSKMEPEGAENSENYISRLGIDPIEWDLLSSDNQCFLMDSLDRMPHFMYMIKVDAQIRAITNDTTGNTEYQNRMMLQAGIADYQGLVGLSN